MARYIDTDELKKEILKRSTSPLNEWDTWGVLNVLDMVETADVQPVVHAQKAVAVSERGTQYLTCTNCGCALDYSDRYCKHCGAIMDEVEE